MTIYNSVNSTLLELFQSVIKEADYVGTKAHVGSNGVIFAPGTYYSKHLVDKYVEENVLNDAKLAKTLFPSWEWLKNCSDLEYYLHQIMHYMSTYGTNFQGVSYIPKEYVDTGSTEGFTFFFVKGITTEEAKERLLAMLQSGMALESATVTKVMDALIVLGHKFSTEDNIRNKEASVHLIDKGLLSPKDASELLRFLIYKASDGETSLLIKNEKTIELLKALRYGKQMFKLLCSIPEKKLAEDFNRFKPLFLALKKHDADVAWKINTISKASKKYHKPMVQNALNLVTQKALTKDDLHWLENATIYALFKAYRALNMRMIAKFGKEIPFIYRVRNGKSFLKDVSLKEIDFRVCETNFLFVVNEISKRLNHLKGKTILLDEFVNLALPTSEKSFVGELPEYTTIKLPHENVAVGIYWHNDWNTRDYDLSLNDGYRRIGWNTSRSSGTGIYYSSDVTNAPDGAVEYMLFSGDALSKPALVCVNQYSGQEDSKFQIMVGVDVSIKDTESIYQNMMEAQNVIFSAMCKRIQRETIGGLYFVENGKKCFSLVNVAQGNQRVGKTGEMALKSVEALQLNIQASLGFEGLLDLVGANVITKTTEDVEVDYDLRTSELRRDTFIQMLSPKK